MADQQVHDTSTPRAPKPRALPSEGAARGSGARKSRVRSSARSEPARRATWPQQGATGARPRTRGIPAEPTAARARFMAAATRRRSFDAARLEERTAEIGRLDRTRSPSRRHLSRPVRPPGRVGLDDRARDSRRASPCACRLERLWSAAAVFPGDQRLLARYWSRARRARGSASAQPASVRARGRGCSDHRRMFYTNTRSRQVLMDDNMAPSKRK